MAYSVSLQTHEIGIRMALGAQKGNILTMVLRNGLTLIMTGIILGVLASLALTRFIASQLSGVKATDPWTFGIVAVIILVVGLAACFFPARRATQVDSLVALHYERTLRNCEPRSAAVFFYAHSNARTEDPEETRCGFREVEFLAPTL